MKTALRAIAPVIFGWPAADTRRRNEGRALLRIAFAIPGGPEAAWRPPPALARDRPPGKTRRRSTFFGCFVLLLALLPTLPATPQGIATAGLRGRVLDPAGNPVEGALVTLARTATGAAATALTNRSGRFALDGQRPGGPYRVTIARIGFADYSLDGIELLLGRDLDLDVSLVPEAIAVEGVVIEAAPDPEFNPGRIGISTLVTAATIAELPTLERSLADLAALSPLARVSEEGVSVAGTNFRFNSLSIDGALNQDAFGLSTDNVAGGRAGGRAVPLEAIEQFQVLAAPFDVRQSGFTGGALNAVTRSGTNDFEASAFGFRRGGALAGELQIDDVATEPELSALHGGFTFAGPIARDRAHFFVAGEWERTRKPPTGFHLGASDPFRLSLAPDSVARLGALLRNLGADPGTAGSYLLENRVANLFARFDWNIGERHNAMLRYGLAAADDEPGANRLPGAPYGLSSHGARIRSRSHSVVFQLLSRGGGFTNEFAANVQLLDDREAAEAGFPQVEVVVDGKVDDFFVTRSVVAGAGRFAQRSGLRQRVIQIADNLTRSLGGHRILLGASATWFHFDREFVPGALGSYRFESLEELALNRPGRYEITIPLTADGANPVFGVIETALYGQDEWRVADRLTLRAGARADIPLFRGRPGSDPVLAESFPQDASPLPGANPNWSLRGGLNWRPRDGTQVRGGIGTFTGRPVFAWLGNVFQNTGLSLRTLLCRDALAPSFAPSDPSPTACGGNAPGGAAAGELAPVVHRFDPDFRFPQDLRTMIAVDQRLPGGLVLSASWMQNRAIRQIFISDENLLAVAARGGVDEGFTGGFGFGVRDVFGVATPGSASGPGMEPLWRGGRIDDRFGPVLRIGNRSGNYTYAATVELRRDFGDAGGVRFGYSLARSADLQDLLSIDVTSNFAATPVDRNPNDPARQRSRFDRPHKVLASAHGRLSERFGGTAVRLLYVGQSGVPYSHVYDGDVNGDGFPGPRGSTLANDLLFVPELAAHFPGSIASQSIWVSLLDSEECLREQRTRILARNTCRTPWSNRVDLRISQDLRVGRLAAEATLDLMNALNLLNGEWGIVRVANPVVRTLRVRRHRLQSPVPGQGGSELVARYIGAFTRDRATGAVRAARPLAPEVPGSQWRMQLGLRVRTGR